MVIVDSIAFFLRGDEMRPVGGFFLFELGQVVLLTALPPNVDLTPSLEMLKGWHKDLEGFVNDKFNQEDLPDTVDTAKVLSNTLKTLIETSPPVVSDQGKLSLVWLVTQLRGHLQTDLAKLEIQALEDRGGRSVRTLWNKPLTLISAKVLQHLSPFVTENVQDGARCFILDRWTATGYHMMRSVECVLRQYRELVTGQHYLRIDPNTKDERFDGYGKLVRSLADGLTNLKKSRTTYGQLGLIVGILEPLQELYRDPLSHPELKALDEEEAKTAFNQGLEVIAKMVLDAITGGAHFTKPWTTGVKF
jgi:hypothetical protein